MSSSEVSMDEDWSQILDLMNRAIKGTENKMRQKGYILEVEHKGLSWRTHGKTMRIVLGSKPLIEHSADERAEHFESIPGLVKAANDAMSQKFGHVRDSQLLI